MGTVHSEFSKCVCIRVYMCVSLCVDTHVYICIRSHVWLCIYTWWGVGGQARVSDGVYVEVIGEGRNHLPPDTMRVLRVEIRVSGMHGKHLLPSEPSH